MIANWFNYFLGMVPTLISYLNNWEVITGVSVLGVIVAAGVAAVLTNTFYNRGTM